MILYLTTPGTSVKMDQGRLVINEGQSGHLVRSIPKEQVDSIAVFGRIHLTTEVLIHCMTRGIPVSYYSRQGKYFGKLVASHHENIFRLKQQISLSDDQSFALALSKTFVAAKVNNQLTLLRRLDRTHPVIAAFIQEVNIVRRKITTTQDLAELIGYEGYLARLYFKALGQMIPAEFAFTARNRQPPKDPFNSLISLGYSILLNEIVGALEAVGLNPYCGFLHQDRLGHMALASDLLEEFRSPLIDALAVNLCKNKFTPEDFFYEDGGCFLHQETLKVFLRELEKKLMSEQTYFKEQGPMTFRKTIGLQARALVTAIENKDPSLYKALWIR